MKRLLLYIVFGILMFAVGCAQKNNKDKEATTQLPIPEKPKGWVSDFAKIFTPEQVNILDATLTLHEGDTGNEIAVVTLDLDSAVIKTDNDFNSYALALFNKWGIGKKEKNNGVLVLLCPNLQKVRIAVGYGLESKLTDDEAKTIIDSIMIPAFKDSDYYTGVLKGLAEIATQIK